MALVSCSLTGCSDEATYRVKSDALLPEQIYCGPHTVIALYARNKINAILADEYPELPDLVCNEPPERV
jgi:hypothetical protein